MLLPAQHERVHRRGCNVVVHWSPGSSYDCYHSRGQQSEQDWPPSGMNQHSKHNSTEQRQMFELLFVHHRPLNCKICKKLLQLFNTEKLLKGPVCHIKNCIGLKQHQRPGVKINHLCFHSFETIIYSCNSSLAASLWHWNVHGHKRAIIPTGS